MSQAQAKEFTIKEKDLHPHETILFKSLCSKLKETRILTLENCKLTKFDPKTLPYKVKQICLSTNKLTEISQIVFDHELDGAYNLKGVQLLSIDLSCNKLTKFPIEALKYQSQLRKIDLRRNNISNLDENLSLTKFKRLKLLDLSSNRISEFPMQVTQLASLQILRLIFNKIKTIP